MKGIDIFAIAVCAAIGWNFGNAAWHVLLVYLSRLDKYIANKPKSKKAIYYNYYDYWESKKEERERKRPPFISYNDAVNKEGRK